MNKLFKKITSIVLSAVCLIGASTIATSSSTVSAMEILPNNKGFEYDVIYSKSDYVWDNISAYTYYNVNTKKAGKVRLYIPGCKITRVNYKITRVNTTSSDKISWSTKLIKWSNAANSNNYLVVQPKKATEEDIEVHMVASNGKTYKANICCHSIPNNNIQKLSLAKYMGYIMDTVSNSKKYMYLEGNYSWFTARGACKGATMQSIFDTSIYCPGGVADTSMYYYAQKVGALNGTVAGGIPRIHGLGLVKNASYLNEKYVDNLHTERNRYYYISKVNPYSAPEYGVYIGSNKAICLPYGERGITVDKSANMNVSALMFDRWFKLPGVKYPVNGWYKFNGKAYYYVNGQYIINTTKKIDGVTYKFNAYGAANKLPPSSAYNKTTYK